MKYPTERSDRIDTTVTDVAVHDGDTGSMAGAAVRHVLDRHPGATILAVWQDTGARIRDRGWPAYLYHVEWCDEAHNI